MRIFKSAWFDRFARRQNIADSTLVDAVSRAERGQIDADLGGGVIKQRVARPGGGKSGGYRSIILYRREHRAFLVFGFAKSERDNIDREEEAQFRAMAKHVLALSDGHLTTLLQEKRFLEIGDDDQEVSK